MKPLLRLALAVCVIALGCVSGGGPSKTDYVQLNVLMEPDATGSWRRLFADFEKENPGIRVNYVEGPAATNTREDLYVTAFLSGTNVYDLVYSDVIWVPKFAAAGWLEDVTDFWDETRWERFIDGALEGGTFNGRIYRVPVQMDAGVLFYRSDLLDAAGEAPPETLEDFVRIAQKLERPNERWGFVWQGKQYEGLSCNFLEVLTAHGGFWIDSESSEVGLDRPQAVAALSFLKNCAARWGISPRGVTTYTEEESRQIFQSGRAVFLRSWPYVWLLANDEASGIKGNVSLMRLPATAEGRGSGTLGGFGFAISSASKHKAEAWRFCEFVTRNEQIARLNRGMGMQPALKSFYEESPDPVQKKVYEILKSAVARPRVPQYAQASDILQRYVSAGLTGQLTPQEALDRAAKETRLLLAHKRP